MVNLKNVKPAAKNFPSCVTRARRLYVSRSKLPFKQPSPDTGQPTKMCAAASEPRMAHWPGTPLPKAGCLNGQFASAS
ncbi:MAG: hypothetical protein P4L49_05755 [Desulfosporosinus sp.]|nr:hypothetical protein [Desulfosporosinus sp.]